MHWMPPPDQSASDPHAQPDTGDGRVIVDVRVLEELVGHEPEIVLDFLLQYRTSARAIMTDFRRGQAAGDLVTMSRATHKLKSSARAIGAGGLGDVCARIEGAAAAGDAQAVTTLCPELERRVAAVEVAIDRLVGAA